MKTATVEAKQVSKSPKKKALQRQLEDAKLIHLKAEQKTGKLRERLERAEARLAKAAEALVAVQALLEQAHAPAAADRGARAQAAVPKSRPAKAEKATQVATHSAKPAGTAKAHAPKKTGDPASNGKASETVAVEPAGTDPIYTG